MCKYIYVYEVFVSGFKNSFSVSYNELAEYLVSTLFCLKFWTQILCEVFLLVNLYKYNAVFKLRYSLVTERSFVILVWIWFFATSSYEDFNKVGYYWF